MSLPGDLTTCVVRGEYLDSSGVPLRGRISFTPSAVLIDTTGSVVIAPVTRTYTISGQGTFTTDPLVATDAATISPSGWTYTVVVSVADLPVQTFSILLPASGSPADISAISPVVPQAAVTSYVPQSGGSMSGLLTLNGGLRIPAGAANGDVLTSDSSGNATWGPGSGAGVFSPMAYGAAGDGVTPDTTAVQAAFTAAHTSGGIVDLGNRNFLTTAPVIIRSNLVCKGAAGAGTITNNTSDVFQMVSGTILNVVFTGCTIAASAGHIFNASSNSCAHWQILGCNLTQSGNSYAIWYQPAASASSQGYQDMLVGDATVLTCGPSATVAPWLVVTLNDTNSNTWRRMEANSNNSAGVPFFYLESTGTNGAQIASDNVFEDITGEQNTGGIIKARSVQSLTIRNVQGWDCAFGASVFDIGTSAVSGGQVSEAILIMNSGRRGSSTIGGGAYDVLASSDTTGLVLINAGPQPAFSWGLPKLSVPESTAIIPAQPVTPATYLNSGAGGTNGTTVTTGNSGGSSGTAFSAVAGTVAFDNTQALSGASPLTYKFTCSSSLAYVYWTVPNSGFPTPVQYLSAYVYLAATNFDMDVLTTPGVEYRLSYDSASTHWFARAHTTGATFGVSSPAANTWYRAELQIDQAAGTCTARIYNLAGVMLDTMTSTGGTYTSVTRAYYGVSSASTSGTFWLAYPAWSNTGWIGH